MKAADRQVVSAHHRYGLRFEQLDSVRLPFLPAELQGPDAGDLLRNWRVLAADLPVAGRRRSWNRRRWHVAERAELQAVFEREVTPLAARVPAQAPGVQLRAERTDEWQRSGVGSKDGHPHRRWQLSYDLAGAERYIDLWIGASLEATEIAPRGLFLGSKGYDTTIPAYWLYGLQSITLFGTNEGLRHRVHGGYGDGHILVFGVDERSPHASHCWAADPPLPSALSGLQGGRRLERGIERVVWHELGHHIYHRRDTTPLLDTTSWDALIIMAAQLDGRLMPDFRVAYESLDEYWAEMIQEHAVARAQFDRDSPHQARLVDLAERGLWTVWQRMSWRERWAEWRQWIRAR